MNNAIYKCCLDPLLYPCCLRFILFVVSRSYCLCILFFRTNNAIENFGTPASCTYYYMEQVWTL